MRSAEKSHLNVLTPPYDPREVISLAVVAKRAGNGAKGEQCREQGCESVCRTD